MRYELQAAATEDHIVLSLTHAHSFELAEAARYLNSNTVRQVLVQALCAAPMFGFLVLMAILVRGFIYYGHAANDSSPPFLGLGVPDWIGILGFVLGIALLLVSRRFKPAFYRNEKRMVYGDKIESEAVLAESML